MWGKFIGGMAGFAMGGPFGAVIGAALGHAAESGGFANMPFGLPNAGSFGANPFLGLPQQREQIFAAAVVVLSAKLAKCDGPVKRAEIDAFKRSFRIPPEAVRDIGRLFDQARDSPEGFETYARQLGTSFANDRPMLENVLSALFAIARADGAVNRREEAFLQACWGHFGLDKAAWDRASGLVPRASVEEEDPYAVLGVARDSPDETLRATWKRLMREHHPDSLASRGVPEALMARAGAKAARINQAWERIKRERGL